MKPSLIPIQSIFCISEGYAARPTMPPNEHKLPSVYIEENRLLARLCARAPQYASTHSDLDDRDSNYWQMLLWDHQKRQLIGGQRMLFATPGVQLTQSHSYLEHCYPSLSKRLLQEGE